MATKLKDLQEVKKLEKQRSRTKDFFKRNALNYRIEAITERINENAY